MLKTHSLMITAPEKFLEGAFTNAFGKLQFRDSDGWVAGTGAFPGKPHFSSDPKFEDFVVISRKVFLQPEHVFSERHQESYSYQKCLFGLRYEITDHGPRAHVLFQLSGCQGATHMIKFDMPANKKLEKLFWRAARRAGVSESDFLIRINGKFKTRF